MLRSLPNIGVAAVKLEQPQPDIAAPLRRSGRMIGFSVVGIIYRVKLDIDAK